MSAHRQFEIVIYHHNNLCEFTELAHKFKKWFCTQKPVLNVRFTRFLVYKNKSDWDLVWRIQLISINKGSKFPTHSTYF